MQAKRLSKTGLEVDQKNVQVTTTTAIGVEVDHLLQRVSSWNGGTVGKKLLNFGEQLVLFVWVARDVVQEERQCVASLLPVYKYIQRQRL